MIFGTMENQSLSQNIIIAVVALVLGASGGYYVGKISAEEKTAEEVFGARIPTNVLSGIVSRVNAEQNSITVDVPGIYSLNFPARYRVKEVRITENTRIVARTQKNGEEFEKELAESRKESRGAQFVPTPPLPHTEKSIELLGIKAGDRVDFSFNPRQNQTFMEREFEALEVVIQK